MAFAPRSTARVGKITDDFKGIGAGFVDSLKSVKNGIVNGSGFFGGVIDRSTSFAGMVVQAPLKLTKVIMRAPVIGPIVAVGTVAGGVALAGGMVSKRQERKANEATAAKLAELDARAAQANSYYNSVPPEMAAALEARQRQGGNNGSQVEALAARQAAASASQAPA